MSRAKKEPDRCKGMAKSTGRRCRRRADDTGYCPTHKTEGMDREYGKRQKHTLYVNRLSEAEVKALMPTMDDKQLALEYEILVARAIVDRALAEWEKWRENHDDPSDMPIEEARSQDRINGGGKDYRLLEIRRKRPDLFQIIDRALGRVGRLTEQQARVVEVRDLQEQLEALKARLPHAERTS